jgi:hypothetical protein
MAQTTYTYSIANDTLNGKVQGGDLDDQIRASAIVTALAFVNTGHSAADNIDIVFKAAISAGDETILDGLVAAHDGVVVKPTLNVHLDSASEDDGKLVVVPFPARDGFKTFFTGAGDDLAPTPPASGRGQGTALAISFLASDDYSTLPLSKSLELQWSEPVQIHDGQGQVEPVAEWSVKDLLSMTARLPATVAVVNGGGTGNANVVPTGLGYNIIVPAAGNGGHDVTLADAVPVPAAGAGYWEADPITGVVSASPTPGLGSYHLLDIQVEALFANRIPLGQGTGVFDIEAYRVEDIHPNWKLIVTIDKYKVPSVDCDWAGWLLIFRPNTSP